jgi:hypothetical protein
MNQKVPQGDIMNPKEDKETNLENTTKSATIAQPKSILKTTPDSGINKSVRFREKIEDVQFINNEEEQDSSTSLIPKNSSELKKLRQEILDHYTVKTAQDKQPKDEEEKTFLKKLTNSLVNQVKILGEGLREIISDDRKDIRKENFNRLKEALEKGINKTSQKENKDINTAYNKLIDILEKNNQSLDSLSGSLTQKDPSSLRLHVKNSGDIKTCVDFVVALKEAGFNLKPRISDAAPDGFEFSLDKKILKEILEKRDKKALAEGNEAKYEKDINSLAKFMPKERGSSESNEQNLPKLTREQIRDLVKVKIKETVTGAEGQNRTPPNSPQPDSSNKNRGI